MHNTPKPQNPKTPKPQNYFLELIVYLNNYEAAGKKCDALAGLIQNYIVTRNPSVAQE